MAHLTGAAVADLLKCTAAHDLIEKLAENESLYGLSRDHTPNDESGGNDLISEGNRFVRFPSTRSTPTHGSFYGWTHHHAVRASAAREEA